MRISRRHLLRRLAAGAVVTTALSDSITEALADGRIARLKNLFNRTVQDERLVAIGMCDHESRLTVASSAFPEGISCDELQRAAMTPEAELHISGGPVHVGMHPVLSDGGHVANLVLLQDLSFILLQRQQCSRRHVPMLRIPLQLR